MGRHGTHDVRPTRRILPLLPIVNLVLGIYLIWRYLWKLQLKPAGKVALAALLMALIEHHWLVSRIFGTPIA
jgi:hypothetical protein